MLSGSCPSEAPRNRSGGELSPTEEVKERYIERPTHFRRDAPAGRGKPLCKHMRRSSYTAEMAANALESIRATGTNIIADTADFQGVYLLLQDDSAANGPDRLEIKRYQPTEGTTNPSILLAAARLPAYKHIFSRVQGYLRDTNDAKTTKLSRAVESLAVDFGTEIWRLTGRVSTELDVALSFDVEGTIAAALRIIRLYAANGVPKEGVRIKIAATWEGIQARTWECKGSRLCITYFASRDTRHRSWVPASATLTSASSWLGLIC